MKKLTAVLTAFTVSVCLCSCGGSEDIYGAFKEYVSEQVLGDDYYIQISRTADSANTLTEASKSGEDCAYMEYDISGSLKLFRGGKLTEMSALTYFVPEEREAAWEDFEFEGLNEKYRGVLRGLLESGAGYKIDKKKNDNKQLPYSVKVQYDLDTLDAGKLFSSGGNFGIVTLKFDTDKELDDFGNITVSCQYDYDSVIYLYAVTFGTPSGPDENGKDGHRPEDIEEVFNGYKEKLVLAVSDN